MPCEACACVQVVMKDSSGTLVSLCQSLGLPCSMQGFLEAVEETQQLGRLSACDISQWASEQSRDMSRVGKHVLEVIINHDTTLFFVWLFTLLAIYFDYFTYLIFMTVLFQMEVRETVEPLKKRLKETEMEREKVRKQIAEMVKREKEERKKMEEEWECRMKEVKFTGEEAVKRLKEEKEDLKRGGSFLKSL